MTSDGRGGGEQTVATARGTFVARCTGEAGDPVVVCQHGFPDDPTTFDDLAARLSGWRVVAPYLRGYDPSPTDGSFELADLAEDVLAVVDAVSPDAPVAYVGHDYGAQVGAGALTRRPERFDAAVLLAGVHPAIIKRNARRIPRQWWLSRYIVGFQLGSFADKRVERDDFAYVEQLWRRWSPGFEPPADHLRHVKDTLARSMPAPVAMYRDGDLELAADPIAVPTRYLAGRHDGCADPRLHEGQAELFTAGYEEVVLDAGHFLHLERPTETADSVRDWLTRHRRDL